MDNKCACGNNWRAITITKDGPVYKCGVCWLEYYTAKNK